MTTLTNTDIQATYGDVLTCTNGGQGLTATLQAVQDGLGNSSCMQLSTVAMTINGTLINSGTGAFQLPSGSTAQRPAPATNGMERYNSQTNVVEAYVNGVWVSANGNGSVTSVTGTANQINVANPTTTPTLTLSNTVQLPGTLTCSNIGIGTSATNTISSTNANGNINITPNGSGNIVLNALNANSVVINNDGNPFSPACLIIADSVTGFTVGVTALPVQNYEIVLPAIAPIVTNSVMTFSIAANIANASFSDPAVISFQRTITQAAHGFAVGQLLKISASNTYALAQANSAANAQVIGIVETVVDANDFVIQFGGYVSTGAFAATTAATLYYLSPTVAGSFTSTVPVASTQVIKPIFFTESTTKAYFINQLGVVIP